jgi:hypothetical protein
MTSLSASVFGDVSDDVECLGFSEPMACCYACETEDRLKDVSKLHGGHRFHPRCWNAVRAQNLAAKSNPEQLRQITANYHNDPPTWRVDLKPWIDKDSRASARHEFKVTHKQVTSAEDYNDKQQLSDDMVLDEVEFISYLGFWRRMPEAQAKLYFERLRVEQGSRLKNRQGFDAVTYAGIDKARNVTGARSGTSYETKRDIAEDECVLKRRRIVGKSQGSSAPWAQGAIAPPHMSAPSTLPWTTRVGDADEVASVHSEKRSESSAGFFLSPATARHEPGTLTPLRARHDPEALSAPLERVAASPQLASASGEASADRSRIEEDNPKEKSKKGKQPKMASGAPMSPVGFPELNDDASAVDFLQRVKTLKAHVEHQVKEFHGKNGCKSTMTTLDAKMDSDLKASIPTKTAPLVVALDSALKACDDAKKFVSTATDIHSLKIAEGLVVNAVKELPLLRKKCAEHLAALKFKYEQHVSEMRKTYMQKRHKHLKVAAKSAKPHISAFEIVFT